MQAAFFQKIRKLIMHKAILANIKKQAFDSILTSWSSMLGKSVITKSATGIQQLAAQEFGAISGAPQVVNDPQR
jgi:hypothetical protein